MLISTKKQKYSVFSYTFLICKYSVTLTSSHTNKYQIHTLTTVQLNVFYHNNEEEKNLITTKVNDK